jgi:hypothetical protein
MMNKLTPFETYVDAFLAEKKAIGDKINFSKSINKDGLVEYVFTPTEDPHFKLFLTGTSLGITATFPHGKVSPQAFTTELSPDPHQLSTFYSQVADINHAECKPTFKTSLQTVLGVYHSIRYIEEQRQILGTTLTQELGEGHGVNTGLEFMHVPKKGYPLPMITVSDPSRLEDEEGIPYTCYDQAEADMEKWGREDVAPQVVDNCLNAIDWSEMHLNQIGLEIKSLPTQDSPAYVIQSKTPGLTYEVAIKPADDKETTCSDVKNIVYKAESHGLEIDAFLDLITKASNAAHNVPVKRYTILKQAAAATTKARSAVEQRRLL